jgi:hypothetical protein
VLAVRDLDRAAAIYEQIGFTLTPRAEHPWGTANRLVQFDGCFLELLAISAPEKIAAAAPGAFSFGGFNRDFLARREGLSMFVLDSHDARADRERWRGAGLQTYEPFDFAREAVLPDGSRARVAFSLSFVTDPRIREAAFFSCQQHAPEFFWRRDFQRHANGAAGIAEVVMCASEPAALADFFSRLLGGKPVERSRDGLRFETARGGLAVLAPERCERRFPGMRPASAEQPHLFAIRLAAVDPHRQRRRLEAGSIAYRASCDLIQVPPSAAFGVALEFSAQ